MEAPSSAAVMFPLYEYDMSISFCCLYLWMTILFWCFSPHIVIMFISQNFVSMCLRWLLYNGRECGICCWWICMLTVVVSMWMVIWNGHCNLNLSCLICNNCRIFIILKYWFWILFWSITPTMKFSNAIVVPMVILVRQIINYNPII